MNSFIRLGAVGLLFSLSLPGWGSVGTNKVVNGSFEMGTNPGISTQLDAPSSAIVGWQVEFGTIDYIGSRWRAGDGVRCLDLSGISAGTISQVVTGFNVGQRYRLSFLMAGNPELLPALGVIKTLSASIGSQTSIYTFDATGQSPSNMGWVVKTLDFEAEAPTLKLQFVSLDASIGGPALDRVSVFSVEPPNQPPVAFGQSLTLNEGSPIAIRLAGQDPEGATLRYLVGNPINGALSGEPPDLVYTPRPGFFGTDSFTFRVSDGQLESADATVTLTVLHVNRPPVAFGQAISLDEGSQAPIRLTAQDPDGDDLTFIIGTPTNGTLTGVAPNLIYTPRPGFSGLDGFTFRVSDGALQSSEALVTITVRHINRPPTAIGQTVTLDENAQVAIHLEGQDPEGTALLFIVGVPTNGILSGVPPNLVYSPRPDFSGTDGFTFRVSDGELQSAEALVAIVVRDINQPPTASSQSVTVDEDTSLLILLTARDGDGDPLTYSVGTPAHGSLSGTAPRLVYQPNRDYFGSDSFTFEVSDGLLRSALATVSITVRAVDDPPIVVARLGLVTDIDGTGRWIAVSPNGTNAPVVLDGTMSFDEDSDSLQFIWFEGGNPVAMVALSTNVFALREHVLTLQVTDGTSIVQTNISFEVLTTGETLDELCRQIRYSSIEPNRIRPLLASCEAAGASLRRGNTISGANQLNALREKLAVQVEPGYPDLVRHWDALLERIIDSLPARR